MGFGRRRDAPDGCGGIRMAGGVAGALVAGGFAAADGGAWVIAVAARRAARRAGRSRHRRHLFRNTEQDPEWRIWGGVVGGFAASFLSSAPATASGLAGGLTPAASSPAFGPAADWIWRTAGRGAAGARRAGRWSRSMRHPRHRGQGSRGLGHGDRGFPVRGGAGRRRGCGRRRSGPARDAAGLPLTSPGRRPPARRWAPCAVLWGLSQQPKQPADVTFRRRAARQGEATARRPDRQGEGVDGGRCWPPVAGRGTRPGEHRAGQAASRFA